MKSTPRQRLFGTVKEPVEVRCLYKDALEAYRKKHKRKPAFVKVDAAKSDETKNIWFWSLGKIDFANVPTKFTRHWCRRRAFALSKPCECCPLRHGVENRKSCRSARP